VPLCSPQIPYGLTWVETALIRADLRNKGGGGTVKITHKIQIKLRIKVTGVKILKENINQIKIKRVEMEE
jgi:hypothetical protein